MTNAADWPIGYRELESSWVWRPMPDAAMFRLSGSDARSWLQGQITQDIRQMKPGEAVMACFCRPTGQLEDVARILCTESDFLVFCERPEILENRLAEFVIMEDVVGTRIPGITATIQGPDSPSGDWAAIPSDRLGRGGFDVVLPDPLPKPPVSDELWNLASLEAGTPLLGVDTSEKTLPPELGPVFQSKTISYTKGCYAGQEVLMRIYSRGHTNKTWVGLIATEEIPIGPFESGIVHRVARHPMLGWIASATVRNEALAGEMIPVHARVVRIQPMPLMAR